LPSPHIRICRHLAALIAEGGLPPLNVRAECDTVNLDRYRLLGTEMLAVCSAWMAPAIRRFALEILPRPTWHSNTRSLPCGAPAAMFRRSARGWRNCCSSARVGTPQQSEVGCGPAVSAIAPAAGGIRGGIGWIWGREGDA
jgi:hypothetical protein